jgi:hypothetical protein
MDNPIRHLKKIVSGDIPFSTPLQIGQKMKLPIHFPRKLK